MMIKTMNELNSLKFSMDINHNTSDMSINFVLKNNNYNGALVEFKLLNLLSLPV